MGSQFNPPLPNTPPPPPPPLPPTSQDDVQSSYAQSSRKDGSEASVVGSDKDESSYKDNSLLAYKLLGLDLQIGRASCRERV